MQNSVHGIEHKFVACITYFCRDMNVLLGGIPIPFVAFISSSIRLKGKDRRDLIPHVRIHLCILDTEVWQYLIHDGIVGGSENILVVGNQNSSAGIFALVLRR